MKPLTQLLGVVAFLATLACIFQGFSIPSKYNLGAASAVQMTQVYGEIQTWLLAAVACGIVALICVVSAPPKLEDPFHSS